MSIDLFKVIPMVISALAFTVSYLGYNKISKIDDNSMIRLIVASETLESDFQTLKVIHGRTHLFGEKNEEISDELNTAFNKVESRIELLYELLLQNKKISIKDLRRIIKSLEEIETNLMELKYYEIETLKELEDTRAFVNPISDKIEIVKSTLSEYDNYS